MDKVTICGRCSNSWWMTRNYEACPICGEPVEWFNKNTRKQNLEKIATSLGRQDIMPDYEAIYDNGISEALLALKFGREYGSINS